MALDLNLNNLPVDKLSPKQITEIINKIPEDMNENNLNLYLDTIVPPIPGPVKKLIIKKWKKKKDPFTKAEEQIQEDTKNIQNNTPDNQKPKGIARLANLIWAQRRTIIGVTLPFVIKEVEKIIKDYPQTCPPTGTVKNLLRDYNNTINSINNITEQVDQFVKITNYTTAGLSIIQQLIPVLNQLRPIFSGVQKILPAAPGWLSSISDDVATVTEKILFKNDGTPRIPEIVGKANAVTMAIAGLSLALVTIVPYLERIKNKLEQCLPEEDQKDMANLSETTMMYTNLGTSNYDDLDRSTYKGFIIKVETVPYDNTIDRYQAVGYNVNGIPLIKGDLSFSSNSQVLVEELKYIIDRDNLEAY